MGVKEVNEDAHLQYISNTFPIHLQFISNYSNWNYIGIKYAMY
jgi:hypothetical protein